MDICTRFNNNGKVIFHLIFKSIEDEFGNERKHLVSNLPHEVLTESYPEIVKLFQKESRHLKKNKRELLSMLGDAVENNSRAEKFFYPEKLLLQNILTEVRLKNIIELQYKIWVAPEHVYSKRILPVRFYVLTCKFLRYHFYYPNKFQQDIFVIDKDEFECQLTTNEMMGEYAASLKESSILFYKTTTIQGYSLYVLCIGTQPELFIVKQ